jgi:hypothetical protein
MMPTDFTQYQPPGVYIEEQSTPLVSIVGTTPSIVAIVGPSVGYRVGVETVALSGTTAVALGELGIDTSSLEVRRFDGTAYTLTTDYTFSTAAGEDENSGTPRDNVVSVARADAGDIVDGEEVSITYHFTDENYFNPVRVQDYDDVKDLFGEPINPSTGAILSPLSLAAKFALDSGAQNVLLVATDSSADVVDRSELADGMARLSTVYDLSVVVPLPVGITGQEGSPGDTIGVGTDLANHVDQSSEEGFFRIGILGYETSVTVEPTTAAAAINSERVMLAHPNKLNWYNSLTNQTQVVAGYYLAAAYAGRMVSRPVQYALTKADVRGFSGIPAATFQGMTKSVKDSWSKGGVAVAEVTRNNILVCRHGVSTNMSTAITREVNITRARDTMMRVLQDTVDGSQLIGTSIDKTTPLRVKGIVGGVLESMVTQGVIVGYDELKARQRPGDQTIIEVKFRYKPSYPLNFILIQFVIDTSTGIQTIGTEA